MNFDEMTKAELKAAVKLMNRAELKAYAQWESSQSSTKVNQRSKALYRNKQNNDIESRIKADPSSIEAIQALLYDLTFDSTMIANKQAYDDREQRYFWIESFLNANLFDEFSTKIAQSVLKSKSCSPKQLYCIARGLAGKIKVTTPSENYFTIL